MGQVIRGVGKVAGTAAKGGVVDAGVTAVKVVPKVLNGEMTAGEGVRQVARSGARGTLQGAAWIGAETATAGVLATIGAPALAVAAVGCGAAYVVGCLFDELFD